MGLLDAIGGGGARRGGGMSPVTMALLGVLAYRTLKGKGRLADMLGTNRQTTTAGPTGSGLGGLLAGGGLAGGLKDLLDRFRQTGQEQKAQSWVNTGSNEAIEPQDLEKALGDERIDWLVDQTGMSREELLTKLSGELPAAVDELTPDGRIPSDDELARRVTTPH